MEDASHTCAGGVVDHGHRVVHRLTRVNDQGTIGFGSEGDLRGERPALLIGRGAVVEVVQTALTNSHRSALEVLAQPSQIALRVETRGVVRMHPRRVRDNPGMPARDLASLVGGVG